MKKYAQYKNSDRLNGSVIRVRHGHQLVISLTSHHYLILTGHHVVDICQIAKVFNLEMGAY